MAITKIPILAMDLFPAQMGLLIKWLAQQDFVIMQRRTNVTGPETYHVVSLNLFSYFTFLHHMHSFYSRICMSRVPSRPTGLPQRGPGETAKTCIANYLPRYVIQSGPRIFRFANPL